MLKAGDTYTPAPCTRMEKAHRAHYRKPEKRTLPKYWTAFTRALIVHVPLGVIHLRVFFYFIYFFVNVNR